MILCGEASLWQVLNAYVDHYHQERHHQGTGNSLLFPRSSAADEHEGTMQCRERLGGLLKYYEREAA
jgi:putative transposase